MFVRRPLTVAATAVVGLLVAGAPAAAQVSIAADDAGGGSGRTGSTVALALTLGGVVAGVLALRRAGRGGAVTALVLALVGLVAGVLAWAGSAGGVGTGNGRGGAIVAVVLGLAGLILGGLALTRSRRAG